jgi:hypothetical protein
MYNIYLVTSGDTKRMFHYHKAALGAVKEYQMMRRDCRLDIYVVNPDTDTRTLLQTELYMACPL